MNKRKRLISIIAGVLAAIMLLGILASLLPVSAASSDEIQDQIEELQKQSAAIDSEMAAEPPEGIPFCRANGIDFQIPGIGHHGVENGAVFRFESP